MGGNALKRVKVVRLSLELYRKVQADIRAKCEASEIRIAYAYEVPGKEDFGDVDVLYQSRLGLNIVDFIISTFSPPDIAYAEPLSFAYAIDADAGIYVQVDMVQCEDLSFAQLYFSYGDANMVLGHLSKCHKISYTSHGLVAKLLPETLFGTGTPEAALPLPTRYTNEVILSADMTEVLAFFGLGEKWMNGLYTSREEIIEDLLQVRYFDPLKFLPSLKVARQSRYSRPFYAAFMERLKKNVNVLDSADSTIVPSERMKWENRQREALEYFNKLDRLEEEKAVVLQMINEQKLEAKRREKFSGKTFADRGLPGRSISGAKADFERFIKEHFQLEDFNVWLDSVNCGTVSGLVDEFLTRRR